MDEEARKSLKVLAVGGQKTNLQKIIEVVGNHANESACRAESDAAKNTTEASDK